jgi:hypothetical protein
MKVKIIFGLVIISTSLFLLEPSRQSTSTGATISWSDPCKSPDGNILALEKIAGYKLYWGYSPGIYSAIIDVGKKTKYTFLNIAREKYVAMRCYDIYGKEGGFSNESVIPPLGRLPMNLTQVELRW